MRTSRMVRLLLTASLVATGLVALASGASAAVEQVDVVDFAFDESEVTVTEGDTVVWRWKGEDGHTVTSTDQVDGQPRFASGGQYEGADFALTFDEPGVYSYLCRFHPDVMQGVVKVLPADAEQVQAATDDNVARAVAWSQRTVEDGGADTVLLGRDDVFADSLASGGLQGRLEAPLLLNPTDALDDRVKAELARVGAGRVVILGGEAAISAAVADALAAEGYAVERIGGVDRIATAFFVADRYFPSTDVAFLARAFGAGSAGFADSLGGGAAAAKSGAPVVLTPTDSLSPTTKGYLEDAGVSQVFILGGEAAVSKAVEDEVAAMEIGVVRLGGENRFDTNAAIAGAFGGSQLLPDDLALVIDGAIANADAWASGFAAALSAAHGGTLVVADGADVHPGYTRFLYDSHPAVVCGPQADPAACGEVSTIASVPGFEEPGNLFAEATDPSGEAVEGHTGIMELRMTNQAGLACFSMLHSGMNPPVASHIHRVSDDAAVLDTGAGTTPGFGESYGCVSESDDGILADVFANPDDYYWNLHYADQDGNPVGTVMGEVAVSANFLLAPMEGALQVHEEHAGPEAFAIAFIFTDRDADDTICAGYLTLLFEENGMPTPITGTHIHDGGPGEAGPVVVPFESPPQGSVVGAECVSGLDPALVTDISENPNDYYFNVHTDEFSQGAVRGQLVDLLPDYSDPVVVS